MDPGTEEPLEQPGGKQYQHSLPADSDPDLLGEFIIESKEYLDSAELSLLDLEADPENAEALNTIFRAFHTIKSTSAFLGLISLSELAHSAEALMSRARNGEIRCAGGNADLILRAVDMLRELVQVVEGALNGRPMSLPRDYHKLKALLQDPEGIGIPAGPDPACSSGFMDCTGRCDSADKPANPDQEPPCPYVDPESAGGAWTGTSPADSAKKTDAYVRVAAKSLDSLIDSLGELVIAQSMISLDGEMMLGSRHELMKKVSHAGKIVRQLQELSLSTRMVPLKGTFQRMNRLVRDLAHKSGKSVRLVAEDRDTGIDRYMADIIGEILVHMIRNAVDHGIEPPAIREQNGKDRTGTVTLSALHEGGNVTVEIRDDGRGLDLKKLAAKAFSMGLIESEEGMHDGEIRNLIFSPGFSTADQVTDVSGRGVGMDIVRKGVESLRGRVDVSSVPGKGCAFVVRLPLTLAITDGMLVQVGEEKYIIPTADIHQSFRPSRSNLSTIAGGGEMVMLRGDLMPMFCLHRLLDVNYAIEDPTKGLLVVLSDGVRRCALLVDALLGQKQFVRRPLPGSLGKIQGIAGAAILADGRVGLILDTAQIVVLARTIRDTGRSEMVSNQPAA